MDKTGTKEYARKTVEKEKHIEDFLEKHVEVLDPDIFVIGRQVRAGDKNLIDLMGMDRDGNAVIIELKRMSARDVISQALDYAVWAASAGYDELNEITKKKHIGKYDNLHDLFQSEFNSTPEPWNEKQKIYIVAERIDEKTREIARYLRVHGVDIKCVEFNFYEGAGKEMVHTDFVVGDPSDVMDEMDDRTAQKWEGALDRADEANRSAVSDLICAVAERLSPLAGPQARFYYMRVKENKRQFVGIQCHKKLAYVWFRVDPDTFPHDDSPEIRSGRRLFFTKETERSIRLTRPNFDLILRCLKHAHDVTSKL